MHEHKRYAGSLWEVQKEEVVIPAGLLIPTFGKDGRPRRLKVRCKDWQSQNTGAKYIAIPGSMKGLNLIGDQRNKAVVVVESELDAYATHHASGDITCVIAAGGSNKNPDVVLCLIACLATVRA